VNRDCRVIMRNGVLQPGMTMPVLDPPPPDPHPNKVIQKMRDAWDMRIIAWDAVWPAGIRPRFRERRVPGGWGRAVLPSGAQ